MMEFPITFIALSRSTNLEIKSERDLDTIISDFIFIFAKEIDYDNYKISIESLQQNTTILKQKIDNLVQKYKSSEPKIQQLNTYFKDLKDDEYFFIFPNSHISTSQSFIYYNYLFAKANNVNFEEYNKEIDDLFGVLMQKYEIIAFDENTKNKIGEPNKSKRICRFCGKGNEDVTFRKVAHSISEALGNKKIITNDECDDCNEKFGTSIENDLILYLNLYRNIFGIKGKNGVPKLKGKNFEIENKGQIKIKHFLNEEEENDPNFDDFKARFETNEELVSQNIYRTLAKYALSVIDKKHLENFTETIKWINQEISFDKLPKVAMLKSYDLFSYHPQLVIYLQKEEDINLPYAVAEFRFTFLTFVFIIPKSSKDKIEFVEQKEFEFFWNFFEHYKKAPNWDFKTMNDNIPRKFVINLSFEQRKK